ncbi:hypothetical protein [Bordetella sp. 15P40C-2]|uniref:hypothetical protein n=1 Tax=Bordetella sp. 15P40C-2 TaxID=2572246 RepID=UPI001326141A|nr:hypothetical protein [Bordetella sp. 15P40C-2]MVW72878.1 hypothetical protein [Bordetella sp. 15P40C-2]
MTRLLLGVPLSEKILQDRRFLFAPFVFSFFGTIGGAIFWVFASLVSWSWAPFVFCVSVFLAFVAPLLVVWMAIYVIVTAEIFFFQISLGWKKHEKK